MPGDVKSSVWVWPLGQVDVLIETTLEINRAGYLTEGTLSVKVSLRK